MTPRPPSRPAQITLYEGKHFTGRKLEVFGDCENFQDRGFMNRVNSIRVESGSWVCFGHPDFRGQQFVLEHGDYPDFFRWNGHNDHMGSCRPVGMVSGPLPLGAPPAGVAGVGGVVGQASGSTAISALRSDRPAGSLRRRGASCRPRRSCVCGSGGPARGQTHLARPGPFGASLCCRKALKVSDPKILLNFTHKMLSEIPGVRFCHQMGERLAME